MTSLPPILATLSRLGLDLPEDVLRTALTHDSYANEHGEESNERLEFLGDAVLDLAVADLLFGARPDGREGELSKLRAVIVSRPVLAEEATRLGLGSLLRLGKGAAGGGGHSRPSILAAVFEAVLGAVFIHHGYPGALRLVQEVLQERVSTGAEEVPLDYKSLLQQASQAQSGPLPYYEVVSAEGPEHTKVYAVRVSLPQGEAVGRGRSKKEAEQAAAKRLFLRLTGDAGC